MMELRDTLRNVAGAPPVSWLRHSNVKRLLVILVRRRRSRYLLNHDELEAALRNEPEVNVTVFDETQLLSNMDTWKLFFARANSGQVKLIWR